MKKETKAERIFRTTFNACYDHAKKYGVEYDEDGNIITYAGLICRDDDMVGNRLCNEVEKLLMQKIAETDSIFETGVYNHNEMLATRYAIMMVKRTIEIQRKVIRRWRKMGGNQWRISVK